MPGVWDSGRHHAWSWGQTLVDLRFVSKTPEAYSPYPPLTPYLPPLWGVRPLTGSCPRKTPYSLMTFPLQMTFRAGGQQLPHGLQLPRCRSPVLCHGSLQYLSSPSVRGARDQACMIPPPSWCDLAGSGSLTRGAPRAHLTPTLQFCPFPSPQWDHCSIQQWFLACGWGPVCILVASPHPTLSLVPGGVLNSCLGVGWWVALTPSYARGRGCPTPTRSIQTSLQGAVCWAASTPPLGGFACSEASSMLRQPNLPSESP